MKMFRPAETSASSSVATMTFFSEPRTMLSRLASTIPAGAVMATIGAPPSFELGATLDRSCQSRSLPARSARRPVASLA